MSKHRRAKFNVEFSKIHIPCVNNYYKNNIGHVCVYVQDCVDVSSIEGTQYLVKNTVLKVNTKITNIMFLNYLFTQSICILENPVLFCTYTFR